MRQSARCFRATNFLWQLLFSQNFCRLLLHENAIGKTFQGISALEILLWAPQGQAPAVDPVTARPSQPPQKLILAGKQQINHCPLGFARL